MCYPAASWRVSDKCRKGGFMVRIKRILIAVTLIVALAVPSCAFAAETGTTTDPGTEATVETDSPVGGDGIVVASSTGKVYNGKKPCFYAYYLKDGEPVKAIKVTGYSADAGIYDLPVEGTGMKVRYTISESPDNEITTNVSSKSYSYKKLKKRSYSFNIGATASKSGSVKSYKSSSKYVSVSKSGKVTVKKGARKGTYKVAVTVKLKNYKTKVKYITVRVR